MEKQSCIKELGENDEYNISRRLQKSRAELEECYRQETLKLKETCIKEVNIKYKNDLERIKKELNAVDYEGNAQNFNIVVNLNNKLQALEIDSFFCKELENCIEDFMRKHSEIDWKCRTLVEELMVQLINTEERARESKHEKESLNQEIEKLSSLTQELNDRLLLETEKNKGLRYKYDQDICFYNKKLKELQQETAQLREVLGRQKKKLEEMQSVLHQYENELMHLANGEGDCSHDLTVDTLKNVLEDARQNLNKVQALKDTESFESEYYLRDHTVELEAVTGNTERQEQSGLFNSPGHSDLSSLLKETFNGTEFSEKDMTLLCPGFCSPKKETEKQNDVSDHQIDLGTGDSVPIKWSNEKGFIFDKAFQKAGEEGTAAITSVCLQEQEGHVGYDESLSQKMEKELEPESKSKQGGNSDLVIWVQEFKCAMQDLTSRSWEETVKNLQQEKENLMAQLRLQEQLVKDVQEQKTASDSVTSEVQSLFGRQLTVLQRQRDQMQGQIDTQMARNKTLFELLGQKAILEKFFLKEQEDLKSEMSIKEHSLTSLHKEKSALEEKLFTVEQHLKEAKEALEESANKTVILEQTVDELNMKMKSIQESNVSERLAFDEKLNASRLELQKLGTEITLKDREYLQREKEWREEVASLRNVRVELEARLEETLASGQELQAESRRLHKEELCRTQSLYQGELSDLKSHHQKLIEDLNAEIKENMEKQKQLELDRKEQIGIIKKLHEREHDREVAELVLRHEEEMKVLHTKLMEEQQRLLDELHQQMEAAHEEDMQEAETLHNLKVEALKLSSNNAHASQLELIQSNLRKEKETALVELREMLNDRHAQEVAVLQNRCQFELEHIEEQHLKEKEEIISKHQSDLDKERGRVALEMEEKHVKVLESLKKEWALNIEISCKNISEELSGKHQTELREMKQAQKSALEEVKGNLQSLCLAKEQVEMKYKNLENQYLENQLALTKLQTDHAQELQDVKEKSKKREEELQQEIQECHTILEKLKVESQGEIKRLWCQLDSARASRQDLSELKEQLLARSSHVEEMENLKKDFQIKWDRKKNDHENELEQLRLYFEEKLKILEENYREELTMLNQRMQEGKDDTLLEIESGQDERVDLGPSVTLLEEMTEKERRDLFEQLSVQLEHHKLHLDKKHNGELELLRSSLTLQYQENLLKAKRDLSDRYTCEIEELNRRHCLNLEQLRARLSEEHLREMTKVRLQSAQDAARQIETEVAERLAALENEHKVKCGFLAAERESVSIQQEELKKLRRENCKLKEMSVQEEILLKDQLEQIKCKLIEDHVNELRRAREEVRELEDIHKAKAEEWKQKWEVLNMKMEEKLLLYKEIENQAECEKQALRKHFELREAEMTRLQEQQAAKLTQLEKSLKEQQNNVRRLEDALANAQKALAQSDRELNSTKALMAAEVEKAKCVFQAKCSAELEDAENRFTEDSKAMTKMFAEECELLLQQLREKQLGELDSREKELECKHKGQILSLAADLQAQHQAEIETLKSALKREHEINLETRIGNMQKTYQAQMTETEEKHLSNLDTLESAYLSEIQLLRDEHQQAAESLQAGLQEQLLKTDQANQELLTQHLAKMEHKHAEELQVCQENLKIELATAHLEELKIISAEMEEAHKEDLNAELEKQRCLLERDYHKTLDLLRREILLMEEQHKQAMQELRELHVAEIQKAEERGHQLQRERERHNSDKSQLEEKIRSLTKENEEANAELKNLQQRDSENRERESLIASLRSDIELSKNERNKLHGCNQQALRLLLIMVKATKEVEGLICKRAGLWLDDSLASGDSRESPGTMGEMALSPKMMARWDMKKSETVHQDPLKMPATDAGKTSGENAARTRPYSPEITQHPNDSGRESLRQYNVIIVGQVLDEILPEQSFESSVPDEISELSEHLCESIFENPDLAFENEERIHKISHSLHVAVEKLLELLAASTKQNEQELNRRNWEACRVVSKHHELMECLNEESAAKNQLVLELHKARGLSEGCLAEKDVLEAVLRVKEESELRLVVELESLKTQFQALTQEHARCTEEQKLIMSQNKALAANLGEREVDLLKEVERLSKAKLELQCQAEKDCATLNAQLKILEIELEEQLNKNQKVAMLSLEAVDYKQQIQSLERQLKSQRDFMDKQAVEREHERDEFQEEIQKLEMQLKQAEKNQATEQSRLLVESLYDEIKERTDDYNKLLLAREQMQKELTARKEETEKLAARVRALESLNAEEAGNVHQLTQEAQKMKKMEAEWKQDQEALQQQQYNNLIQISTLQSKLDEIRHRMLPEEHLDHVLQGELKVQEELLTKKAEVSNLLEQLKLFEEDLISKNEEILHLSLKFEGEKSNYVSKIIQLQEENACLKENIEKLHLGESPGDGELALLQFLKTLLEEKNQETDHLNKQIVQLEDELGSCRENQVLEKQKLEIEHLKSVIEHLHADEEQLVRDKSDEIEQLRGIIANLQKELELCGPFNDELNDSQDHSNTLVLEEQGEKFQNERQSSSLENLGNRGGNSSSSLLQSNQEQLQGQLERVLADKEALQQLLEEQESKFKVERTNLEQNQKNVQESSEQYFKELTDLQRHYKELQEDYKRLEACMAQRSTDLTVATSSIQDLKGKLREREAELSERDTHLQTVSKQKAERAAEVLREKEKVEQLEAQLQGLVDALHDKEAACQSEISELRAVTAELKSRTKKYTEELEALRSERALFHQLLQFPTEEDQNEMKPPALVPEGGAWQLFPETKAGGEKDDLRDKPAAAIEASSSGESEKDVLVTDLKTSSKNFNIQGKHLEEMLWTKEAETANKVKEQRNLQPQTLWLTQTPNDGVCRLNNISLTHKIPENFQKMIMDETLWDSPERMREEGNSLELPASVHLTPFSEMDGVHSIGFGSLSSESPVLQSDSSGLLRGFHSYSHDNQKTANIPLFQLPAFSGPAVLDTEYGSSQENISPRDAESFTLMPSELQDDLRSAMSRLEGAGTGFDCRVNTDLALQRNNEIAEMTAYQDGSLTQCLGMVPDVTEPAMKDAEVFSQKLKNMLKMVYEESYKILDLSEKNRPVKEDQSAPQAPLLEGLQKEGLTLLEAVQSLKYHLNAWPDKEGEDYPSAFVDWRGDLLQAVQGVLERERTMLQSYLQSHFCNSGSGDKGPLVEKLEHIAEQQERQQKVVLEHLLSSDRNGLLTEIQDLQAQLRLMHLQNQEKLQQLQESLINAENHGSKQEHQLRRQVELLEYKLQQEKSIAGDWQTSLKSEQEKASEVHKLLKQEHAAVMNFRLDLSESKKTNEKLQKALQDLQKDVIAYSSALESKEKSLTAVLQDLQSERLKEKELQATLDEQQRQHKIQEDENSKAIEELQAALELQCIQNNQLSVALEHEQTANNNLRKELQIEHSRCEALLSKEQNKSLELQKTIDAEKSRSLELSSALNHERVLTEQLSMRINYSCQHKDSLQELQAQLSIERAHARELAAIIEKTQQPTLDSKKQVDKKQRCEEPEREHDLFSSLQITQASLQTQKQDIIRALETERGKEAHRKREWEQLQAVLRSLRAPENAAEQGAREAKQELQRRAPDRLKERQEAQESQLELQHWHNTGRIEELQHMLEELKEQERYLLVHQNQHRLPSGPSKNCATHSALLPVEQQKLENIRGQLLVAATFLSEFANKNMDKALHWPALKDEAVSALWRTLEDLKAELLTSSRPLVTSTSVMNSIQDLGRIAWPPERAVSQNSLKAPEYEITKTISVSENKATTGSSNLKLQKLYRKYLRAESFRKALIYQKKYLLLLLGGFQECEQATLSLIARMGIYPSPPDLHVSESRSQSLTKFRSVVRVVIAISRLKFLVKKWHKVSRKELVSETYLHKMGHNSYPRGQAEALQQLQLFPDGGLESPGTRETGRGNRNGLMRTGNCSPKAPPHGDVQFTRCCSQASSKDPEHSLAEYIAHLEALQQRLGKLLPEPERP